MSITVWLFRYDNADGSAKDWAYPVNTHAYDSELTVFFGRTGSTLRQTTTPARACKHHDPAYEALCRRQAKLAKGYCALGEWQMDDKRRIIHPETAGVEPDHPTADHPKGEPSPARWYWRAPVQVDPLLHEALVALAERFYAVGWLNASQLHEAQRQPQELWLQIAEGQTHGMVLLEPSHRFQIAGLLSLSRVLDTVHLANEAGQTVTDWPSEMPVTHELLSLLGLQAQSTWYGWRTDTTDEWFF